MDFHNSIIQLQRTIGNQAVQRLMCSKERNSVKKVGIQPKLKISQLSDMYEQEADRVAEQVMRITDPSDSVMPQGAAIDEERIDRKCRVCEMKEDEDKKLKINRKPSIDTFNLEADDETTDKINSVLSTGGSSLDGNTKEFMESRFGGYAFSNVKIHTDDRAARSVQSVNALAYTVGNDIVFGKGQYRPSSTEGKRLLAHELSHTIQQSSSLPSMTDMTSRKFSDNIQSHTLDNRAIARENVISLTRAEDRISRQPRRGRRPPKEKSSVEVNADFVKEQVKLGRFTNLSVPLQEGQSGPPMPGGAFWLLNGLSPHDMFGVLRLCGKDIRTKLLAHIADTEGVFDRPRLESALRSTSWGENTAGEAGLEFMDAIRNAGTGSFAGAWARLSAKSRTEVIRVLRTLPRDMLTLMQTKLTEAPAADVNMFTQVIADLLGTGTNMQANDVIDLQGLSGLDRTMASIYNSRGQLIEEQARDLGVSTHAVAGIMQVESGGMTFGERTGKTIIRFENHVFWDEWGRHNATAFNTHFDFDRHGKRWELHRFRESPAGTWEAFHGNQEQEWRILEFASSMSGEEPAYRSASWGAGQIMGFNATRIGFATAVEMANAFNRSERSQVTGILDFIRANRLAPQIRRGDYLTLATRYNGSGQARSYAAKIEAAARSYQRVTRAKLHVIP
jgi:N-acetylmuramidase-like protein/uncharacterized protein DUF4157